VFRRWEVYNAAQQNDDLGHMSYHMFRFMAVQKARDLKAMQRALGFSDRHHDYCIRRLEYVD
jgi:hypothetical protein